MRVGQYSYEEFLQVVKSFHGYVAPGVLVGGLMVDLALSHMDRDLLMDALCETPACLPDAVQLLTPCTLGNGWLKVVNLGRFALSLFEKYDGEGVRVFVDRNKLESWPEVKTWLYKLKPKSEQNTALLLEQIRDAGHGLFGVQPIRIQKKFLGKKRRGPVADCSLCGEPYPAQDGTICRGCKGEAPYRVTEPSTETPCVDAPQLETLPIESAVGMKLLHDMTMIVPHASKNALFKRGQVIEAGDLCRLQRMGRRRIHVQKSEGYGSDWVHEDEAALTFAEAMAGDGVKFNAPPREGKVSLFSDRDGLFVVNEDQLRRFNEIPGIICATRKTCSVVSSNKELAGTRAIPLFISRKTLLQGLALLQESPLLRVKPLARKRLGILVTGNEIFDGLVQDRFIPVIRSKAESYGLPVVKTRIVPDEREVIREGVLDLVGSGAEIVITTAGLSVDPDDVTRLGLLDAGAKDLVHGAPILPGAMTLLARIGSVSIIGVPACALYHKITSLDLILPRILAELPVTHQDLSRLGHGALCLGCRICTFPKCSFGG